MRVLVTGGAGYIGSHTVKSLLRSGHDPIVIDSLVNGHEWIVKNVLKVPFIKGSIGDKSLIKSIINGEHNNLKGTVHEKKNIEGILHFAAYAYVGESVEKPLKYYLNNVLETLNMLNVICKNNLINSIDKNIPIVFSSSCATYGIPKTIPIFESAEQKPINPYGESKLIIEKVLRDLAESNSLKSIILRYFNAAGASPDSELGEIHNPETHLIPLAIEAAMDKNKILRVYGSDYNTLDGTCVRDYVHVCDLADAHVLALDSLFNKKEDYIKNNLENNLFCNDYNLGNGNGVSVKQIINSVEKITQSKVPVKFVDRRPGDPECLIASSAKARKKLGWVPKYEDINLIVDHAVKWHKNIRSLKKND